MPSNKFSKKSNKKSKKKTSKKVFKKSYSDNVTYGQIQPYRLVSTMKYVDNFTITSTTGTPAHQVFRANSIYDPDFTGGGHQPYLHDQMANLYNRYRVHACSIKVVFQTTTSAIPAMLVVNADRDSAAPYTSGLFNIMEYNRRKAKYSFTSGYQGEARAVVKMFKVSKDALQCKDISDQEDASALFGGNPAEPWYYHVSLQAQNGASTVAGNMTVILKYYVELYDPLNAEPS